MMWLFSNSQALRKQQWHSTTWRNHTTFSRTLFFTKYYCVSHISGCQTHILLYYFQFCRFNLSTVGTVKWFGYKSHSQQRHTKVIKVFTIIQKLTAWILSTQLSSEGKLILFPSLSHVTTENPKACEIYYE